MASSFVAKKLLAATRSSSIRHHAATVVINPRRGFFNNTSITDASDPYSAFMRKKVWLWLFKFVPHTICRTTRVTSEGRLKEAITGGREGKDTPRVFIPKGLKSSVNIPGIETVSKTDEGLCVFIDLELNEPDMKDFDDHQVEVVLKKLEALFFQGYVQKQDTRRDFFGRVNFTPMQTVNLTNEKHLKIELKDGGLMVTIPNK